MNKIPDIIKLSMLVVSSIICFLLWQQKLLIENDYNSLNHRYNMTNQDFIKTCELKSVYLGENKFLKELGLELKKEKILIVFNMTVCGKCFNDQIKKINKLFNSSKDDMFYCVIGARNPHEYIEIRKKMVNDKIGFKYKIVNSELIDGVLLTDKKENGDKAFIDTPIYFRVKNNIVIDILKPNANDLFQFEKYIKMLEV